jgi:hypothetical protein
MGMGFKVHTELAGAVGRLDLCVELEDRIFLIIELKYLAPQMKFTKNELNAKLANIALAFLPKKLTNECLAPLALSKFDGEKISQLFEAHDTDVLTNDERNAILAKATLRSLPNSVTNKALASLATQKLTKDEIVKLLPDLDSESFLSDREIVEKLLKVANEALKQIDENDYQGTIGFMAKEITTLGLVFYADGNQFKAVFGPEHEPRVKGDQT